MNLSELMKTFEHCEIYGDKIIVQSNFINIMNSVKQNYHFDMLKEITAVDHEERGIELIYRIYSPADDETLLISTFVKDQAESISKIFDSAYADEKEIYDLFGVKFTGNDELERLYMPEEWEGHPLKKDYENNDERLRWNEGE